MCTGAIINSRIKTVFYGAPDPKAGSCGTLVNLFDLPYNHRPEVIPGILADECADVLRCFFKDLRARKKLEKKALSSISPAENILPEKGEESPDES